MKKIAISGSTGFISGSVISQLKDYSFIMLEREDFKGDGKKIYEKIKEADIILNLAGAPIIKRWTKKRRKEIYDSRIKTTEEINAAIERMDHEVHLISASAIGIYDSENSHDEKSRYFSSGFVRKLLEDWEAEANKIQGSKKKVTIIRIGLVLSDRGGMLKRLIPVFKTGMGGTIGKGNQMMSFIHIKDLVRAIEFIIEKKIFGVVNMTAPEPVTNIEFTKKLGTILKKPAFLKVPVFMLKLMFGKGAETIMAGQKVKPAVLLENGFEFKYPDISSTLNTIIESA